MVSQVARPAHAGKSPASSMEDKLDDINIDSLDGLVMAMKKQSHGILNRFRKSLTI
jgi:hypothetical protein